MQKANILIGDFWSLAKKLPETGVACIPTNQVVMSNGNLIMGAGLALQAVHKFPRLPRIFGKQILSAHEKSMATPTALWKSNAKGFKCSFAAFSTKRQPDDISSLFLIRDAAITLAYEEDFEYVLLPAVGCGLGGLRFEDVYPILHKALEGKKQWNVVLPNEEFYYDVDWHKIKELSECEIF